MRLPSRLPYSPLLRDCDGADRVSEDPGRIVLAAGRLAGRLAGRRDLGVVVLGRDEVDFGLSADSPDAEACMAELPISAEPDDLAAPDVPVDRDVRDAVRELGRVDVDLGLAAGLRPAVARVAVVRVAVARDVAVVRLAGAAAAGFAADIVLAAAVRAFAAVVMALVAVFIARMADDIVLADAFALVAAAVILLAAEVTLVAADDTVLAATAGVAEVRLAAVRRAVVARPAVARVPVVLVPVLRLVVLLRAAVDRAPVERDAVDRDAVPRVDRAVVLRAGVPAEPAAVVAAPLREDLELDVDCGRLAVPLDALRLTDLLRAVLAELRRVAARVVD
jgi:hypothetical protein